MNWADTIIDKSFFAIGACRTGKTYSLATTAWNQSSAQKRIAVAREPSCESESWKRTHQLPFNNQGLSSLSDIMSTHDNYAVILLLDVYDLQQTKRDILELADRLNDMLCSSPDSIYLLLDAFGYYATMSLLSIGPQTNYRITVGYTAQEQFSSGPNHPCVLPPAAPVQVATHLFSWCYSEHTWNYASLVCNESIDTTKIALLALRRGQFRCSHSGVVFTADTRSHEVKKPRYLGYFSAFVKGLLPHSNLR